MVEKLKIGIIVKPQGVRGELKVQPLTDDITRFKELKEVIIEDKTYRIVKTTIGGGVVFISLFGIADRDAAETFRGKFLSVTRENAVKLEEGRYFVVDIIGCALYSDGENIGQIIDVTSANTDILTVKLTDGKIMRFPFLKDLVEKVDVQNKIFAVKSSRLEEVACYED